MRRVPLADRHHARTTPPPIAPDPAIPALRRRLYAPGATDADVTRYRAAVDADAAARGAEPGPQLADAPVPRRRVDRRTALLLLGAALVVAVAVLPRLAPAAPIPSAARPVLRTTTLPLPETVRSGFVAALVTGRSAGLSDVLTQHPGFRPRALSAIVRSDVEEHDATGATAVVLDPSEEAAHGGRMTVLLLLSTAGSARWQASRIVIRDDGTQYHQDVADARLGLLAGTPLATTFRYRGAAPDQLAVDAPAGVHWDAVVVFSD